MAKIASVRIDWMEGWANSPIIHVTLDDPRARTWPRPEEPAWIKHRGGIHYAPCIDIDSPIVAYFFSDGSPTSGYGGQPFDGTFVDGTQFHYRGAWSSRAACVNAAFPNGRVVDVVIDGCATAILASYLIDWFKDHQHELTFGFAWVDTADVGYTLEPTDSDGNLKETMREARIVEHI